jgi:RimJ/RimL family protein N-acetyltransferase
MKQKSITLRPINMRDFRFLFNLLKERDSKTNISHKKTPTYSEHVKFVKSKPYSKWCIIQFGKLKVGSIYLSKNNEIGIFIKKQFHGKNIGHESLIGFMEMNPRKRYLANVNPKNRISQKFFKRNGFKLIQHTFELEK